MTPPHPPAEKCEECLYLVKFIRLSDNELIKEVVGGIFDLHFRLFHGSNKK
nr:hypothetical protein [uncultured Nitrososphaera sp.]